MNRSLTLERTRPLVLNNGIFVGNCGLSDERGDYLAPEGLRSLALGKMVEGDFNEMFAFLAAKVSTGEVKSNVDQVAWELLTDKKKREEVAKRMKAAIEAWGGYIPVLDRGLVETWMVEIESEGEVVYKILGEFPGVDGLNWYEQKDLWPLVFYENWWRRFGHLHPLTNSELLD